MWRLGHLQVSHFTVRDAALRLRLLQRRAVDAEFTLVAGHRPRLWADSCGRGGLAAVEAHWAAARVERWAQLSGQRRRCAARPAGQALGSGPLLAPGPRVLPLQRAAAAGRAGAGLGMDESDVLMAPGVISSSELPAVPPWRAAYVALQDKRLDHVTRHFRWRLLQGGLRCGAASVQWCPADSVGLLHAAICCGEPGCALAAVLPCGMTVPALADFSHTFLHCPRVRPAVGWLCALWARIAPSDATHCAC
jgi:hypothetical protein